MTVKLWPAKFQICWVTFSVNMKWLWLSVLNVTKSHTACRYSDIQLQDQCNCYQSSCCSWWIMWPKRNKTTSQTLASWVVHSTILKRSDSRPSAVLTRGSEQDKKLYWIWDGCRRTRTMSTPIMIQINKRQQAQLVYLCCQFGSVGSMTDDDRRCWQSNVQRPRPRLSYCDWQLILQSQRVSDQISVKGN